jgi:hypothetical protein
MSFARAPLAPSLVALFLAVVGCGGKVVYEDPGSGGGGNGAGGDDTLCDDFSDCGEGDDDGEPPVVGASGIAESWTVAESWGYAPAPSDTLLLAISSEGAVCGFDPIASLPNCEKPLVWHASIPLPAELQFAGAFVDFEQLLGVGPGPFFGVSQVGDDGFCSGGGGTVTGTLEVVSIDATSVAVRIVQDVQLLPEIDGEWRLERCPAGDDPAPPSP